MFLLLTAFLVTAIAPVRDAHPNRQPQLASAPGLTALVFGSGNSIWFAPSRDEGRTFSTARQVAEVPVLAVGRHRGPRVVIAGKEVLVSAVYGEKLAAGPHAHGLPEDGDLVVWRSQDGGQSWSKPVVINDVPGSAREGLHAIAAGSHGQVAVVWLDLRSPAGTQLYGAYSDDQGATWSRNVLIYAAPSGSVCQCCGPSLTFAGDNQAQVMFRNILDGARDMYMLTWNLHGQMTTAFKLGTGSWKITACPMDGGGLARRGNNIVAAWRRDKTVYLDQVAQPEQAIGEGKDVAIALGANGPYVAWATPAGIQLHTPAHKDPICLSPSGEFPTLNTLPNGSVIAAWEQDGTIQVGRIE
jgi:hypothetical protein